MEWLDNIGIKRLSHHIKNWYKLENVDSGFNLNSFITKFACPGFNHKTVHWMLLLFVLMIWPKQKIRTQLSISSKNIHIHNSQNETRKNKIIIMIIQMTKYNLNFFNLFLDRFYLYQKGYYGPCLTSDISNGNWNKVN